MTVTLLVSQLDYFNTLYIWLPLKTVQTLQLVKNASARILTGTSCFPHETPILKELHKLPVVVC